MARKKSAARAANATQVVKRKGPGNDRKKAENEYSAAYRAALMNPFSSKAQGARVPDMYSAPTVAKHIAKSYTFTTGSAAGYSNQLIILPNLYMPIVAPYGVIEGGVSWLTMDNVAAGTCIVNATSTVSTQLTNYRIVGYGVRLYNTGALTSTAGRVLVATNPVSSWVNYKTATIGGQATTSVNAAANGGMTLSAYGLPTASQGGISVVSAANMPSMQNCVEVSLTSLAAKPLVITPKVNSPEAFEFRQSADSAIGFSINNQTSASYVSSGDASYLRVAGHELIVISVNGAPVDTSVLQVEVVYHIEGAPTFASLSGDSPVVVASPATMAEIVSAAARSDPFKQGLEYIGNAAMPGLGSFVRNVL